VTAASARIIAAASPTVCAVLSSACATTVDNSGMYVYYLKVVVSVCFRCLARTVGFSGTRLHYTCACTTNQAERRSGAAHLLVRQGHERGTAWWSCAQGYPYSRHPLEAQAPLNSSVMACHSLERTQADPLCLSENLIS